MPSEQSFVAAYAFDASGGRKIDAEASAGKRRPTSLPGAGRTKTLGRPDHNPARTRRPVVAIDGRCGSRGGNAMGGPERTSTDSVNSWRVVSARLSIQISPASCFVNQRQAFGSFRKPRARRVVASRARHRRTAAGHASGRGRDSRGRGQKPVAPTWPWVQHRMKTRRTSDGRGQRASSGIKRARAQDVPCGRRTPSSFAFSARGRDRPKRTTGAGRVALRFLRRKFRE